jgi:hypothetical protein
MTNHSLRGAESAPRSTPVPYSPTLNTELLERVRQLILMRPGLHDQQVWIRNSREDTPARLISRWAESGEPCGTTACTAGWAAILGAPEHAYVYRARVFIGSRSFQVSRYAAHVLGLTVDQQCFLFWADASREAVLWALKWLPDHPDANGIELSKAWRAEQRSETNL